MKLYLLLIVLLCISPLSMSKEIAITFDDSPRQASGYFSGPSRAEKLVKELKTHNVRQVVFFSNSSRLDLEGMQRLRSYSQAGHIIANHTHDHPDFNKTGLEEYAQNFLLADSKLSQFKSFKKVSRLAMSLFWQQKRWPAMAGRRRRSSGENKNNSKTLNTGKRNAKINLLNVDREIV